MSVEQFAETIKTDSRLTDGQKDQCYCFLVNYPKTGIDICQRYIAVVTGEIIVKTDPKKPPLWRQMRDLLTVRPGLTRKEIEKALGLNHVSVLNCLSKGLRRGRFVQVGNSYYAV